MSDDTTRLSELATVAGSLYGALLEAREWVRVASLPTSTVNTAAERCRAAQLLERIDGALADAADYLGAVSL